MAPIRPDYATIYAKKVVNGEIIASKKNILTCERHLRDIENPPIGYEWRPELAIKVSDYLAMLPDTKTGKTMPLMLFQHFIVGSLYGWVYEGTSFRRFTKGYISMARKQGKSIIVNGLGQYEMIFGTAPERGREIYISSLTFKQANVIFNMAKSQLNQLRSKSKYMKKNIKVISTSIEHLPSESTIKALANNPDAVDGTNPSMAILDEFAGLPDTEMYSRLKTGMSQQDNPLTLIVSTAGDDLNNPMYAEEYQYITKLLNQEIVDENYFVYCAEMDSEEEIGDESLWIKAMPLLENEAKRKVIMRNIKTDIKEQEEKGQLTNIKIKNFNLWQANSHKEDSFCNIKDWESNTIDAPDISGTDCWIGVDLSRLGDISAVTAIHALQNKMYIDTHGFFGYEGSFDLKIKRDKINYQNFIDNGIGTLTDLGSGLINYKQITDYIIDYANRFKLNVKGIYYDRNLASMWLIDMETRCPEFKLIEVAQSMMGLSETIKQFRYDIIEGKVVHSNNELLNISVRNARIKMVNDNLLINKTKARNKIDPIVAGMNAYTDAQFHEYAKPSLDEKIKKRGIIF
ncbi:terminase large subunit [Macrococcus capreoli]|uniref:terminase large subunit n=1 Tax=Macrococcus capreoli TaxID=2982690 RepID=UPI0021D5A7E6|nr:phage terminase family protein [Macrococcus sp. TMW 2.2395]MCU7557264.1 phage terminase family protein [Macrococcus sp. TMW 2.2395]